MAQEIECARCGTTLRVAPDETDRWLTCPRCLASVANPNRAEAVTDRPAPVLEAVDDGCPECGSPVQPGWRRCPHCESPLYRPPIRRVRSLDHEVKRDSSTALVVTAVMGGLLLTGVIMFFATGAAALMAGAPDELKGILVLVGAIMLAVVAGVIALVWTNRNPTTSILGGVLGTLSLTLGGILIGMLLVIIAIIATCASICPPGRPPGH
jgi:hypothetical protein